MRNTFVNRILDSCETRKDIFIISGDAGLGVFDEFQDLHPERFLNLGVAEQNTTSFAAGLAMTGFKVYLYNIIPFVMYRCYEQVRNDICYQKLPVSLVGIGSGITYAPQGMTHYSIEDIGLAQTLPNLTVISPIDPVEAKLAAEFSLQADGPVYVRLAKRGEPEIHKEKEFDIRLPRVIAEGVEVAVLFHGSIAPEALEAHRQLAAEGYRLRLVSVPMLQPLNEQALEEAVQGMKCVITVEEHYVNSGLGSILQHYHSQRSPDWGLICMGIPCRFIHDIKDTPNMREHLGISAGYIVTTVKNIMENGYGKVTGGCNPAS